MGNLFGTRGGHASAVPHDAATSSRIVKTRTRVALVLLSALSLSMVPIDGHLSAASTERPLQAADSGSILFIENVGQADAQELFAAQALGGTIHLARDTMWITVTDPLPTSLAEDPGDRPPLGAVNLRLSFTDANPEPMIVPFGPQQARISDSRGPEEGSDWYRSVPVWSGVRYEELYPGFDLEITSDGGEWVWRLIDKNAPSPSVRSPRGGSSHNASLAVRPLAQGEGITLQIEGAEALSLATDQINIATTVTEIVLPLLELVEF